MYRFTLSLLLFLSFSLHAMEMPLDKRVLSGKLSNGLHYYIMHNDKPKNMASLRLFVRAGSLDEEENQRGLAHFVEHMAFNGTTHFEKNRLVSYLESIGLKFGGDLNAGTNFESTLYRLKVPIKDKNIDTSLQIMRDWAGGLLFNKDAFNKERGVILEEKRLRNSVNYRLYLQSCKLFFEGTKYAKRDTIGTEKVLKNAPVERAIDFYNKWYRPESMTLIIVGDITPKVIEKKITQLFSDLKNKSHAEIATRAIPQNNTTRVLTITDKELSLNSVKMFFLEDRKGIVTTKEQKDELIDAITMAMFNSNTQRYLLNNETDLLGFSMNREDISSSKKMTLFDATFQKGHREEAFEELSHIIYGYAHFGFKKSTFENIKKRFAALNENSYRGRVNTESSTYASWIAQGVSDGSIFVDEEYRYKLTKRLLKEIKLEEINNRYKEILKIKDRSILFMGTQKKSISKERVLTLIQRAKKSLSKEKKTVKKEILSLPPKPTKLAKIVEKKYNKKLNIYSYKLENGVQVDFKQTKLQKNEVELSALSNGGDSNLPLLALDNGKKAVDWVTNSAPGKIKIYNMDRLLADKKLSYRFQIAHLSEHIDAKSVTKDFETLLHILYLQITQPKIDTSVAKQLRKQLYERLQEAQIDPAYRFEKDFLLFYYKNNPRILFDTKESIAKLDSKEMLKIFKKKFSAMNHFHFVIVGDIETKKLEKLIQRYLGVLPTTKTKKGYNSMPYDYRKGTQHFIKKINTENIANISLQYRTKLPYSIHTNAILDAIENILSVRLRNIIREEKSGTYGVRVSCKLTRQLQNSLILNIAFASDPKRKDELLNAIDKAIKEFIEKGVSQKEITNYQTEFKVAYEQVQQKNRYWVEILQRASQFDTPLEEYLHIDKEVESLTPDEIRSVAKEIFNGDVVVAERIVSTTP